MRVKRLSRTFAAAAVGLLFFFGFFTGKLGGGSALADDTIKHPGDHPDYHVELEPHGVFGWYHRYASDLGYGAGARVSIPLVQNGFIPSLNNNVAITFGIDFVHYQGDCYFYDPRFGSYGCDANYLMFPIALQWNFFVAERWSVGGEPGLYIYHGFFDTAYNDYCTVNRINCYSYPTSTGVDFAFFLIGRYHFSEKASLTMRIGYPYISIGASFFL